MTTLDIIILAFFTVCLILIGIYVIIYIQMNSHKSIIYLTQEEKKELLFLINLHMNSLKYAGQVIKDVEETKLLTHVKNKLINDTYD